MVFQEPMTALDPAFTVGSQITEVVRAHDSVRQRRSAGRAVAMLDRLGIPNARAASHDYPHQFSGGMRQRVMLALALVMNPKLLLADEPTTALDVTIQAQILDLIAELRAELGLSVVLITHNLGVVNEIADRVAVMYAGEIVETGPSRRIFADPRHPYTQGLLKSMPYSKTRETACTSSPAACRSCGAMPPACRFAARCPNRIAPCVETHPTLRADRPDHELRCYNPTPVRQRAEPLAARCTASPSASRSPADFFGRTDELALGSRRRLPRYPSRRDAGVGRRIGLAANRPWPG